jgi:hypothetical protein
MLFIGISSVCLTGLCAEVSPRLNTSAQIVGHLRPELVSPKPVGRVPRNTEIRLAIGLTIPKITELHALIRDLYDPASPNYRKFLTPDEFVAQFSPSAADYQRVIDWAKSKQLKILRTHNNRLLLDISGPAAKVEQALHVNLELAHRPDESRFYRPDRDPSIDLAVPIGAISGLSNYERPKHFGGSAPGGVAYFAKDLRNAYVSGSQLDGRGQTIGIMVFDGYDPADVVTYRANGGLPALAPGNLTNDLAPGLSTLPPQHAWSNFETIGDIDMAMAMAPAANVKVYVGDPSTWASCIASFESLIHDMASPPVGAALPMQVSNSYGCWSFSTNATNALNQMVSQGQSFFVPSGDSGGWLVGSAPYADLQVTEVGGTTLSMYGSGASYQSEVAWAGSGGGISTSSIPSYQASATSTFDPSSGASTTNRNVPDVSIVATNLWVIGSGAGVYWQGTSAGAPLWAGFMALVNERWSLSGMTLPVGWASPIIWSLGRNSAARPIAFNDITSGSAPSTITGGPTYTATVGYDLTTGWGTPKPALIDQMACVQLGPSGHVQGTPPACEVSIGTTLGEPHITTLDGLYYDFQAAGDFLLATTGPTFVTQVRQQWTPNRPNVAFNKAVAMRMGKTRVAVFLDPTRLVVDGRTTSLADGKALTLPDQVDVSRTGNVFLVKRSSGETVRVEVVENVWVGILGGDFMDISVSLNYLTNGKMRGLLGNGNGSYLDDIALRDGTALRQPVSFGDLYQRYAENMHVRPEESLFGEENQVLEGTNQGISNPIALEVPVRPFTAHDLSPREYKSARAACRKAGVTAASLLDACTLDTAVLGPRVAAKIYTGVVAPFAIMEPGSGIVRPEVGQCRANCAETHFRGTLHDPVDQEWRDRDDRSNGR